MRSRSATLDQIWTAVRWTEAEARLAVEEFRASGLSATEFGARYGVHPVRLQRWAGRLARTGLPATRSPVLAPVHIASVPLALVEVILGARVLRIPAALDPDQVTLLVRAVEMA